MLDVVAAAGIGESTLWDDAIKDGVNKKGLEDMPYDWLQTLRIDLDAVINGTRLAVREMMKHNNKSSSSSSECHGVIINTSSVGGLNALPATPVYAAAKHAVVGFTRSCRPLAAAPYHIRVNALCPSFTDTALVRRSLQSAAQRAFMQKMKATTGELLLVENVTDAVMLIISDERYRGAVISVSQELGVAQHHAMPLTTAAVQTIQVVASNRAVAAKL